MITGVDYYSNIIAQFINLAVGVDQRVSFADAGLADERGVAGIAGPCVQCH